MSNYELVLTLLSVATLILAAGNGYWLWHNRPRPTQLYGLPRCKACRRLWDEHTNMGACPDGSGRLYEELP